MEMTEQREHQCYRRHQGGQEEEEEEEGKVMRRK